MTLLSSCTYTTELNVCDSESHIICYNNGTCENGICSCTNLFTGPQCLKNLCKLYYNAWSV